MKESQFGPFATAPSLVVDYQAELKKLEEERKAAAPAQSSSQNQTTDSSLHHETKHGLQRLIDFLAKAKASDSSKAEAVVPLPSRRRKVIRAYQQLQKFEDQNVPSEFKKVA